MAANAGARIAHGTLTANTEDVVTLSAGLKGGPAEIVHHGGAVTDPIYFRTDGVAAAKAADENQVLVAGERLSIMLSDTGVLSLICNGTAGYSVLLL